MEILDRLPTKDRLIRWGMGIENHCLFCHAENETMDHLFAECTFAKKENVMGTNVNMFKCNNRWLPLDECAVAEVADMP
ncbi:SAE1-S9-protein [Gossypium australe]|uniref:SAE1-S9-protein n=1 Tax=Gossypium australe TaxID=47621 RepID=A0A5B6WV16_9ROSI|nr:SAE1-S9-protein [Gossypium australe]